MQNTEATANSIVEVDLQKVKGNIARIRSHVGRGVEILYTAKANGYGHGLVVPALYMHRECGINYFSTGMLDEAIALRENGLDTWLLVMGGVPFSGVEAFVHYGLVATVYNVEFAKMLSEEAQRQHKNIKIHIKIETGMNRLGVKPGQELEHLLDNVAKMSNIEIDGVYTHLADSYSLDKSYTHYQLAKFEEALHEIRGRGIHPKLIHAASTGACVASTEAYYDMVRLAALIYGLDISPGIVNRLCVEPCLRWTSFVTNVRWIEAGESVSYYHWFVAEERTKIAVLGFGLGDGYVRTLVTKDVKNNAWVLIHGKRARLIDINIDQAFADVTNIEDVKTGDAVTLIGRDGDEVITSIGLAEVGKTSNGHICCNISSRPFRKYVGL